jgi:hypothetical protein
MLLCLRYCIAPEILPPALSVPRPGPDICPIVPLNAGKKQAQKENRGKLILFVSEEIVFSCQIGLKKRIDSHIMK